MALTKVQTIGIETGVSLTGVTTVTTLNASTDTLSVGGTVNFGGNVSIAGTLTYEDVTNIDSVGIITARSDISIADKIIHTGDTNTAIRFPAADTFTVETGGSERLRVASDGLLDVSGGVQVSENVTPTTGSGVEIFKPSSTAGQIQAYNRGSSAWMDLIIKGNTQQFHTNGSEALRIDSSGNLLIGTTSATSELTVRGGGTVAAFEGTGGSASVMIKDVDDSSLAYIVVNGGNFDIQTSGSSYSTKLRVTPAGLVGIGTDNPSGMLDITSSGTGSQIQLRDSSTGGAAGDGFRVGYNGSGAQCWNFENTYFRIATNNAERLRISSAGYMGLGTGSPRRHFHIHESASGTTVGLQLTNAGTGEANDSQGFQLKVGGDGHAEIAQMENSNLRIFTNATERLRIVSTGRVAIGNGTNNASPTSLFQVKADDGEAADLYVGTFENLEATAGQSYGVNIRAGSNNTDHGLRVRNKANDATHFLVSGAGQVTKPLQTAFMAALNANSSVSAGIGKLSSKVGNSYTNVTLNTGNCYNSSTTTFTAPVDGVYVFSNQISSSSDMPANSYLGAEFYKNGSRISCGWRRSHSQGYQRVTANIILSLSANDTVEPGVESAQGGTLNGGSTALAQYNHFLGYLLH